MKMEQKAFHVNDDSLIARTLYQYEGLFWSYGKGGYRKRVPRGRGQGNLDIGKGNQFSVIIVKDLSTLKLIVGNQKPCGLLVRGFSLESFTSGKNLNNK